MLLSKYITEVSKTEAFRLTTRIFYQISQIFSYERYERYRVSPSDWGSLLHFFFIGFGGDRPHNQSDRYYWQSIDVTTYCYLPEDLRLKF